MGDNDGVEEVASQPTAKQVFSSLENLKIDRSIRRNRPGSSYKVNLPFLIICYFSGQIKFFNFHQDWNKWPDEIFEEMESTLAVQQVRSKTPLFKQLKNQLE
jgi:hypothetical protein